ncbi:RimK family alpha-L-glutamate ligase [Neorhizobium sp. Rsf11]|uniref:RimK family alpha-L-glutamate ligase n=2 Tax=Neorhizobium TaxID=1525371 RepID=A0ABV0M204_9HYPH|nr:RimK family alpha-L-glutamate ligase [Neorhizobium petrolearium]MCC2611965.1 RimK family alpha-L-glutamate ligase [Neorhizobium petrolearium]WGI67126.1 RimK family alpha-L-glutamate ligase [Neorhizobium petrolearium]
MAEQIAISDKILIVSDKPDGQVKQLRRSFRELGSETLFCPLADIAFDTRYPSGIDIPALEGALPAGVIVRSISGGTFEAVTRRLGILHALTHLGVPVWNSAKAIERCVDKSTTTFFLANAGIPTPQTFAVEGPDNAKTIVEREASHGPLVLKPLFGSQGRGIRLIRSIEDLPDPDDVDNVYYLQRLVVRNGPPYRDYRIFVSNGEILGMMGRCADGWITNIARGAKAESVAGPLRQKLEELALAATSAIGTDFAGIDIVQGCEGNLLVLEVNSMPAWTGLQSVVPVRISDCIARAMVELLNPDIKERPAA